MKDAVQSALAAIIARYGDDRVGVVEDGQGGAWVEISDVCLGDDSPYRQTSTFVVLLLPFNLPAADIYPIFIRHDLERADGQHLGEGFSVTSLVWPGENQSRPVVQVSRRTRGTAFSRQTAVQKLEKVLEWVRRR